MPLNLFKNTTKYPRVRKLVGKTTLNTVCAQFLRQSLTRLCIETIQNTVQKFACSCLPTGSNYIPQGALANTVTIDKLRYSQATRNELLARLLSEITLEDDVGKQVKRRHFLEGRGEGVGIILNESEVLSGKNTYL